MTTFLRRCAPVALLILTLGCAKAAYNPAIVAADARWVVFADFDALRSSLLGKELVTAVEKAQSHATGGMIGIDISKVLTTIGSLTAYGTNLSTDPKAVDGTLIVQGTADLRKIAESLLLQATLAEPEAFTEVKDLPFPAYAIVDPKAPEASKMQLVVAFPPEPIVIVSKSKAQLQKARDVFRGTAPSLAKALASPFTKLAANAAGAYLFGASVVPTDQLFPQNAPQARILQLANSGSITLGERGPNIFAHAELIASSDQSAEKLMKILQGMTAMLSLAETNDKQLAEFLNSTAVNREKDIVTLDLAYSSARLAQMVQNLRTPMQVRAPNRQPVLTMGSVLAEWGGDGVAAPTDTYTGEPVSHLIENVRLVTDSTITVGRAHNGGKNARFTKVEIMPVGSTTAALTFRTESMRNVRGTMWQFQFPGSEGAYTLKITYVPDPDGKTKFAVSVKNPNDPETPPAPHRGPLIPQPKL